MPERRRRPGPPQLTPEWRERISHGVKRYWQRRRESARVRPADLAHLRTSGTVPARLAGFLEAAEVEAESLIDALGGLDRVSPQRRALVEDVARCGLVLRAELARYVQTQDSDAAGKVSTLTAARRAGLQALGLDRAARDVPSLADIVEEHRRAREARESGPNGAGPASGSDAAPIASHAPAQRVVDPQEDADE